jgi:hypothetical protein
MSELGNDTNHDEPDDVSIVVKRGFVVCSAVVTGVHGMATFSAYSATLPTWIAVTFAAINAAGTTSLLCAAYGPLMSRARSWRRRR